MSDTREFVNSMGPQVYAVISKALKCLLHHCFGALFAELFCVAHLHS